MYIVANKSQNFFLYINIFILGRSGQHNLQVYQLSYVIIAQIENEISSAREYHILDVQGGGAPPPLTLKKFVLLMGTFT